MGRILAHFDDRTRLFIESQHVFFVATAPLSAGGHVNLSPKGGALRVIGERRLAWIDHVGSGVETIAHLRENGRIVVMWCSFEEPPKILRVHGRGWAHEPGEPRFEQLAPLLPEAPPARSILEVEAERISESCGFGVPLMRFDADRDRIARWSDGKGPSGLREYQLSKNRESLDGLPALRWTDEA